MWKPRFEPAPSFSSVSARPKRASGQADLGQVEAVARVVARNLNGYKLIIEKSTVPAITAQWLKRTIVRYNLAQVLARGRRGRLLVTPSPASPDFDVASNPEFLREGRAVEDFFHPDRIVCGVDSDRAREILTDLYRPLRPPPRGDQHQHRRIDQARRQRLSLHQDFVHQHGL